LVLNFILNVVTRTEFLLSTVQYDAYFISKAETKKKIFSQNWLIMQKKLELCLGIVTWAHWYTTSADSSGKLPTTEQQKLPCTSQ
jgi:hypothetical protein